MKLLLYRLIIRGGLFGLWLSVVGAAIGAPVKQTVLVEMRDGIRLATDLYLPGTNQAYPVILVRTRTIRRPGPGLGKQALPRITPW